MTARPLALLLALAACTPDFGPASEVTKLRLLDVRAEPPELAPAPTDGSAPAAPDAADLAALVADPEFVTDDAKEVTVVHVACTPAAGDPSATACTAITSLADPRALLPSVHFETACADPGRGQVGGLTFAGVERCAKTGCAPVQVPLDPADPATSVALPAPRYVLPSGDLGFGALPAEDPVRVLGVDVVTLALALDAPAAALAPAGRSADACAALAAFGQRFADAWDAHAHVAAVKRIRVRGPGAVDAANANPPLAGVSLAGIALPPPGGTPAAVSARAADLLPLFPGDPDALRQRYTRYDAAGKPIEQKVEDWAFSWFATAGDLKDLRTQSAREPDRYTPAPGRALVYVVARDLRGGTSWAVAELDASP